MAKDRAAPFSRKHRRYWIPVTGGMVLIGLINVIIGLWSYKPPEEPQRIELHLPGHDTSRPTIDAHGTLGLADIPGNVMRAFNLRYPKTIPSGAELEGSDYIVSFRPGAAHAHATFHADGTFVSED